MVKRFFIGAISAYRFILSPLLGSRCRFHPSCSRYTQEAIQEYGLFKGMWKGLLRIVRCHPFSKGGFDPVK